ncbi:MAG: DUF393 domain-containing protein [Daejeonella sp.]
MKALKNHTILYDAECPMCSMYTKKFITNGMLEETGRASYQNIPENVCPMVDRQRAANEIALVNNETGEVSYGISSLFKVIANSFPVFKPLFLFKPFIFLMTKIYAFIAYNRRVIIPSKSKMDFEIQPTFRLDYRIAYLTFTWFVTAFILSAYAHLLIGVLPAGNNYREYLICGGQIVFQGIIVTILSANKRWDYLGNMMTISFAGALILLIPLFISIIFDIPPVLSALYFMAVAGLMFLEHIRRTKLLDLGWVLTITWVIYRMIVLLLILKFN